MLGYPISAFSRPWREVDARPTSAPYSGSLDLPGDGRREGRRLADVGRQPGTQRDFVSEVYPLLHLFAPRDGYTYL